VVGPLFAIAIDRYFNSLSDRLTGRMSAIFRYSAAADNFVYTMCTQRLLGTHFRKVNLFPVLDFSTNYSVGTTIQFGIGIALSSSQYIYASTGGQFLQATEVTYDPQDDRLRNHCWTSWWLYCDAIRVYPHCGSY
jgi:hypothetical protein